MDKDSCVIWNEIVVVVVFFSGQRKTLPCLSGNLYRPHLVVKGDDEYLGIWFAGGMVCCFDEPARAVVRPLYEGVHYNKLRPGTQFYVMEGNKKVGEGSVEKILPYLHNQPGAEVREEWQAE